LSESPQPDGTQHPISAQPWSTPSGDPLSASPTYTPGAAPIPQPPINQPPINQPPINQPPANQPPANQPPTTQFPSVNYAPPGYAPDYGPGYQYPPPQPYGAGDYPPPYTPAPYIPPPRKSNAPLIAVVVAVALLLCGGVSTAGILIVHNVKAKAHEAVKPLTDPTFPDLPGGGLPTDLPTDTGKQIQVTYEVTGDGPAEIIYLPKLGASPIHADNVKLPWRFTATTETPTLISVIAMRAGSDDGSITCRALVDGKEVKKTSSGANGYATAACTYFALD
jgi:hypothetical protein